MEGLSREHGSRGRGVSVGRGQRIGTWTRAGSGAEGEVRRGARGPRPRIGARDMEKLQTLYLFTYLFFNINLFSLIGG